MAACRFYIFSWIHLEAQSWTDKYFIFTIISSPGMGMGRMGVFLNISKQLHPLGLGFWLQNNFPDELHISSLVLLYL